MKRLLYFISIFLMFTFFISKVDALYFNKYNENGELIKGALFEQRLLDGTLIRKINDIQTRATTNGFYGYTDDVTENKKENAYKSLTSEQKELINSIKTLDDYNRIKKYLKYSSFEDIVCSNQMTHIELLNINKGTYAFENVSFSLVNQAIVNGGSSVPTTGYVGETPISNIVFVFYTFNIIEETYTPIGYEKETMVLPMFAVLNYSVDDNGKLTYEEGVLRSNNTEPVLYKYNSNINYNSYSDFYEKMSSDYIYPSACVPDPVFYREECAVPVEGGLTPSTPGLTNVPTTGAEHPIDGLTPLCTNAPIVIDKNTSENLKEKTIISTFVNGEKKAYLKKNSQAEITVKVTNNSRSSLHENTVTSKLPNGFTYAPDSANKDGIYNSENNTITWNLVYLDSMATETFTYNIVVPNNIDTTKLYQTTAIISNELFDSPIVSISAEIDTGRVLTNNPETGDVRLIILNIFIILSVSVLLFVIQKNSIRNI